MMKVLTRQSPLLHFFLFLIDDLVFCFRRQIHQDECIVDEIFFNLQVEWGIGSEAGSVVNFQDLGF